jgi:hypothetical protein
MKGLEKQKTQERQGKDIKKTERGNTIRKKDRKSWEEEGRTEKEDWWGKL